MKKTHGFTLVELLGVITLLGVIAVLIIPVIDKTVKEGKEEMYQQQLNTILLAAKNWGTDNLFVLPDDGGTMVITLKDLKKDGYVDKEIKNPKTGELISDSLSIRITGVNGRHEYEIID